MEKTTYENPAFQMQENGGMGNGTQKARFSIDFADKKIKKSLVQITKEVLPRSENYRNSRRAVKRPSLGELHGTEEYVSFRLVNGNLASSENWYNPAETEF
ncbi:hypothetical protein GWI33_004336 [Rhynchophorus ferrugineus]|uniref:Uncharacterized protein n=1 Tax=Rhynchophorus ferrugineus TaxID=354439 RepID=A0A834IT95_RHYFE|nr:hypothetical protein GWI33_004336 [Rhynchophorus ferrugineus]